MAKHKHRCMRCGEEFDCYSPNTCMAKYDVLPNIMVQTGYNKTEIIEHCPNKKLEGKLK